MKCRLILGLLLAAGFGFGAETINIACVGDSTTQGPAGEASKSYPAKLQAVLGSGYEVKNFGAGWATALMQGVTDEAGARNVAYAKTPAYHSSLSYPSNVVIVMLGMNDSKPVNWDKHSGEFEQNLVSIVESYKKSFTNPTVLLATTAWVANDNYEISCKNIEEHVIPMQRKVAEKTGCAIVDVFAATKDKKELYAEDGIHFNEKGNEFLANLFAEAIRNLKK